MESLFSESYYLQKWDIYMEIYEEADLEKKLKKRLKVIDSMPISEADKAKAYKVAEDVEARKIASECREEMLKRAAMIKSLLSGKASLGYTTKQQNIEQIRYLRSKFDFTCLALREFKKAHNIQ